MKKIIKIVLLLLFITQASLLGEKYLGSYTRTDSLKAKLLLLIEQVSLTTTDGTLVYYDDSLRFYNGSEWFVWGVDNDYLLKSDTTVLVPGLQQFLDSLSQHRTDWRSDINDSSKFYKSGNYVYLKTSTDSTSFGDATPSEKVEINGNLKMVGNIGYGITPIRPIHLYGTPTGANFIRVTYAGGATWNANIGTGAEFTSSANMDFLATSSYIRFVDNSGEIMRLTGGQVGIGAISPNAKLHIESDGNTNFLIKSTTGLNQKPEIRFQRGAWGTDAYNDYRLYDSLDGLYVTRYLNNAATPMFQIKDDHILNYIKTEIYDTANEGSATKTLQLISPYATAGTETMLIFAPTSSHSNRYAAISGYERGSNNVDLYFYTGNAATITKKMIIDYIGNIYIGYNEKKIYIDSGLYLQNLDTNLIISSDVEILGDSIIYGSSDPDTITHASNKTNHSDSIGSPAFIIGDPVKLTETNGLLTINDTTLPVYINEYTGISTSGAALSFDDGSGGVSSLNLVASEGNTYSNLQAYYYDTGSYVRASAKQLLMQVDGAVGFNSIDMDSLMSIFLIDEDTIVKVMHDSIYQDANVHITGNLWVDGSYPSDFVFEKNYELLNIYDYYKQCLKIGKLPEFENRNRKNIGQYNSGLEEAIEKQVCYNYEQQKIIESQSKIINDLIKRIEKLESKK